MKEKKCINLIQNKTHFIPEADPAATVHPSFKKSHEVMGPSVFIVFTVLKRSKKKTFSALYHMQKVITVRSDLLLAQSPKTKNAYEFQQKASIN